MATSGGQITFNETFGKDEWNINGALSADGETWTGRVEGSCPFSGGGTELDSRAGDRWQRIRIAVADTLVSSARAQNLVQPNLDEPWTAFRNVPCGLLETR